MDFRFIDGTITTPQGFTGAAICGGIKEGNTTKKDIMMVKCDTLCNAAAVYTKNLVKSDAILVTQEHLKNGKAQAIVANSGNANTCNADGYKKASDVCKLCASTLNIAEDDVIVASTGVIGVPLPLEPFEHKLYLMKKMMSSENGSDCAEAIMTTDTVKKEMAMEMTIDGKTVTVGGIAKGSGMIHINMGTMLSFVTTDCAISSKMLEEALKEAVEDSYNMVSVDGDTSTNDTLAIMASGKAGNKEITTKNEDYKTFVAGLTEAFKSLAKQLAKDGEGATKLLICDVSGAKTKKDAVGVAKTVIGSSLVKTAMFGADANWGRVLCAIGYSGMDVDISKVKVTFKSEGGEVLVCENGAGVGFDEDEAKKVLSCDTVIINIELNDGEGFAEAYGCDLTYDYVKINGDYRT
ncbi:MAG: bifunctional glutamate N-acetyltransferase/amino-acid acetyltransferase ArgJ [Ruminococcus sp.]|nr:MULTISPECIES: bifunctional glutamate N-acetyltransferase/amino-acid acetyltransferase ArgJ [Ruminococcus]MCI5599430.1 bifunctional glutamate N-acetyltransferase/amino-acid acetyltransferase ArgJ [Ruminococcus sp.]MDD5890447.1 bifunctional glutamate N-acetyltransferase/amino-acid acetyltransferase ArgJ [Ruminococcus sp.]MDY3661485.1 bifunctional glutamate N-acetyltransferase/amino-acid acetyltransferase ArgJ [Ruminococcus bovis]